MAGQYILLVEPEPVIAEITAFRLELLGYEIESVDSAEEALTRIPQRTPDLLITDLVLPGLEGVGLIERLTEDQATSQLPIMVLSIDADLSRVEQVVGLGAQDFLVVPFDLSVLQAKVEKLMEKVSARVAEVDKEQTPVPAAAATVSE